MSSGQSSSHQHTEQLVIELKRHLSDPKVRAYLNRPYTTDASKPVLYTGGSSVDGRIYYVDPDVPEKLRDFVLWHERVEKALREVLRMDYATAHKFATAAERHEVEESGRRWEAYNAVIDPIVRKNEGKRISSVPRNLDLGPYKESHAEAQLRKIRHAKPV